jgi:hypothetical protein
MRSNIIKALCVVCLMAMALSAQDSKPAAKTASKAKDSQAQPMPPMPKPGPEVQRLAYFLGTWKTEGTMEASDFGPGGKFTGTDHNEWFPGGFFLVTHSDGSMGAMGKMKEMATMGYDTNKKAYTYHAVNSMGEEESSAGTVKGSDWDWRSDDFINGKPVKGHFTIHEDSPTSYSMKFEGSSDGGKTWKTIMTAKATKAAAAATK